MDYRKIFSAGIVKENPVFILFLGMCPALGVTSSLENSIGMGAGVIFVLLISNIVISIIRKLVPDEIRIPVYIVIIASVVTILEMIMKAYLPSIYESLGIFIPLIVVNCVILGRAEAFASKNSIVPSIVDALGMGIGFTIGLVSLGFFRELLGTGGLNTFGLSIQLFPAQYSISIFTQPAGAFITLGLIVGVIGAFQIRKQERDLAEKRAQAAKMKKAEVK